MLTHLSVSAGTCGSWGPSFLVSHPFSSPAVTLSPPLWGSAHFTLILSPSPLFLPLFSLPTSLPFHSILPLRPPIWPSVLRTLLHLLSSHHPQCKSFLWESWNTKRRRMRKGGTRKSKTFQRWSLFSRLKFYSCSRGKLVSTRRSNTSCTSLCSPLDHSPSFFARIEALAGSLQTEVSLREEREREAERHRVIQRSLQSVSHAVIKLVSLSLCWSDVQGQRFYCCPV